MDKLMNILFDNADKLWTLLSVIIGGFITYFSTSTIEKRKIKRQAQKEKLEQVLIPYCTCLEASLQEIKKVYTEHGRSYTKDKLQQWFDNVSKPLEYLQASRRVYLSDRSKKMLVEFDKMLHNFEVKLDKECDYCLIKYKKYLEKKLMEFPNVYNSMMITFSMSPITTTKMKLAIINKTDLSLLDDLNSIEFVHNDEPENYRTTCIKLNDKYRQTWSVINYGAIDITDIEDNEEELACILLDFINDNFEDEKEMLMNIIENTSSRTLFIGIYNKMNEMRDKLIKEIDKVANY
ncbi:hypothetical protein [Sporosalibacterium faouarense]|uniref:hypothetical protein n=1 Tax=Sporosalibacterium faouarense TaxID=516123 RepID=UPI00192C483E|nr:hypothetical protein [Sporosalibacterium faouarense]